MTDWDSSSNILEDIQAAKHAIERGGWEMNKDKDLKPIVCANCHDRGDLFMIGQPSTFEERIGWVFVCRGCFELIKANKLFIGIKIETGNGHSKEA